MKRETLHMETTKIKVSKTVGEIEELLAKNGVRQIFKDYNANGDIEGISFTIRDEGGDIPIMLPFKWQAIQKKAQRGETGLNKTADEDQARRVAARLILRWLQAQMSIRRVDMVNIKELFLAHIMVDSKTSFYQKLMTDGGIQNLLIGDGK